jgi:hypothetical protein
MQRHVWEGFESSRRFVTIAFERCFRICRYEYSSKAGRFGNDTFLIIVDDIFWGQKHT